MRKPTFFCLLFLMLLRITTAGAQPLSYVYIQGDKQTPFYVKLEGEMQPRYGKNYCILSRLVPGPVNLEILFQQNAYPAQHFTVNVPESGSRGFLLTRLQDSFALYDLQQSIYLYNGNLESEDHFAVHKTQNAPAKIADHSSEPAPEYAKPEIRHPETIRQKPLDAAVLQTSVPTDTTAGEHFIEGIALDNNRSVQANSGATTSPPTVSREVVTASNTPALPNSDCPEALSKEEFGIVYRNALNAGDDEARTAYLFSQLDKCYACWQARSLASMLSTDAARFTVLKKIYPRITDQNSFPLLDDLLKDASYKEAFDKMIHPKQ